VTDTGDTKPSDARARDDEGPAAEADGLLVVFCGGCNPQIDRSAVARELGAAAVSYRPGASVYLSGCARACASGHRLAFSRGVGAPPNEAASCAAVPAAVVAGTLVDGVLTPEGDIVDTVIEKLKE
jgi:hypothetical protein